MRESPCWRLVAIAGAPRLCRTNRFYYFPLRPDGISRLDAAAVEVSSGEVAGGGPYRRLRQRSGSGASERAVVAEAAGVFDASRRAGGAFFIEGIVGYQSHRQRICRPDQAKQTRAVADIQCQRTLNSGDGDRVGYKRPGSGGTQVRCAPKFE